MKLIYSIVGTRYLGPDVQDMLSRMPKGTRLLLRRDPGNQHDPNAVRVYAAGLAPTPQMIGYVKATEAAQLARTMTTDDIPAVLTWAGGYPQAEVDSR